MHKNNILIFVTIAIIIIILYNKKYLLLPPVPVNLLDIFNKCDKLFGVFFEFKVGFYSII